MTPCNSVSISATTHSINKKSQGITMLRRATLCIQLALFIGGCSFMMRSPDQYRNDTAGLLATKSPELTACFDNALKSAPGTSGKVTIHFLVEAKTGKINNAAAVPAQTTAPQTLVDCVLTSVNGLVLSPADQRTGDATFEYDFAGAGLTPPPVQPPK